MHAGQYRSKFLEEYNKLKETNYLAMLPKETKTNIIGILGIF